MALGFVTSLRNAVLDPIKTAIDAGGAAGFVRIYDGTRPATGGTATTLLAQGTFSYPSAAAASGGVLTFSAIAQDASADATGTATWFRVVTSAGVVVFDGGVGSDMTVTPTSITAGQPVNFTSATITDPNT